MRRTSRIGIGFVLIVAALLTVTARASAERIRSPALDALWKRCDAPEMDALLGRYGQGRTKDTCFSILNELTLGATQTPSNDNLAFTFSGGVLERLTVKKSGPPGANVLPLGLQLGVTTAAQIEALRGNRVVEQLSPSSGGYRLVLAHDNPFTLDLALDASRRLQSVAIAYRPTPAEIEARKVRNQADRVAFDQKRARVTRELHTPSPRPYVSSPSVGASSPAPVASGATANPANAPTLRRIAELNAKLDVLRLQIKMATSDRDLAHNDRSFQRFDGTYSKTDAMGGRTGPYSAYSREQSGSAILAEGNANRRLVGLEAQLREATAEIEQLQRQLR